ncbi:Uncharacterised protein [Amycolatopsis camponoti]|uniref:Uncharacterized protein n=1 Tax=Amycolatopsis camponoti TaxID=2606593 RepID=A0A6I8LX79_9PSEU|nr:hypothetical protein [Amycolatopsis camponoti]VVJ20116.1 Uncharacterised protein [Amycolatopsis camponoti]
MPELFVAPLAWLGQKAADVIVGQLVEKGVDRLTDRFADPRRKTVVVPQTPAAPTRHLRGNVTSDIVVRHVQAVGAADLPADPAGRRADVGHDGADGARRDRASDAARGDYLIGALVLDPPEDLRGKPVLRDVGAVRHWVAGTDTDQLTIETTEPTTELLERLGLQMPDGSGPFRPGPPKAAAPPRQLTAAPGLQARREAVSRLLAQAKTGAAPQCRAATSDFGPRCTSRARVPGKNGLCQFHHSAVTLGETVYEWSSGKPIT